MFLWNYNQGSKIMGKTVICTIFVSPPFSSPLTMLRLNQRNCAWDSMNKTCAKPCYGLTMLRLNEQNLCQARLWVNNVEIQWEKLVSS